MLLGFAWPGALAVAFVAFYFYLIWRADFLVADTIRRYGRNVDSGQIELFVASYYAAPSAVLFAVAAALNFVGPVWTRWARIFAWIFVLGAPAMLLAIEQYRIGV